MAGAGQADRSYGRSCEPQPAEAHQAKLAAACQANRKQWQWGRTSLSFFHNAKLSQPLQTSWAAHLCGKEQVCHATYGSWVPGRIKERFITYSKGHENFLLWPTITCFCNWPVKAHRHMFILLQSSSSLLSLCSVHPLRSSFIHILVSLVPADLG